MDSQHHTVSLRPRIQTRFQRYWRKSCQQQNLPVDRFEKIPLKILELIFTFLLVGNQICFSLTCRYIFVCYESFLWAYEDENVLVSEFDLTRLIRQLEDDRWQFCRVVTSSTYIQEGAPFYICGDTEESAVSVSAAPGLSIPIFTGKYKAARVQIAGNRFTTLDVAMAYFASIDIVTVAVKYRLVPEHPAPTALDDAYAGLVWTVENAANFDIDPMKIMILGSSDGAPIAAGCAILAQRNQNPSSAHKCS